MLTKALSLARIASYHKLAVDSESFIASFHIGLRECLEETNKYPILHISAHGNDEGIGLTNGETVTWEQLRNLVVPINNSLNGNLLVCMSSCKGFSACRMAMDIQPIPFFSLVGHIGEPTWSDTAVGYATFYHLLAKGQTVNQAVESMRIASGDSGFHQILGAEAKKLFINQVLKRPELQALHEELKEQQ